MTLERDGRPPKEVKLGTFKLTGLGGVRITPRRFDISGLFHRSEQRYAGETLMIVEPD